MYLVGLIIILTSSITTYTNGKDIHFPSFTYNTNQIKNYTNQSWLDWGYIRYDFGIEPVFFLKYLLK